MAFWAYEIIDENGNIVATDSGYETEQDAEDEAIEMRQNRNHIIRTFQIWEEL